MLVMFESECFMYEVLFVNDVCYFIVGWFRKNVLISGIIDLFR